MKNECGLLGVKVDVYSFIMFIAITLFSFVAQRLSYSWQNHIVTNLNFPILNFHLCTQNL